MNFAEAFVGMCSGEIWECNPVDVPKQNNVFRIKNISKEERAVEYLNLTEVRLQKVKIWHPFPNVSGPYLFTETWEKVSE